MAIAIVGAIGIAAGAEESANSSSAAKKAANQQSQAAANANNTQLQMYNQTRSDLSPYSSAGTNALSQLTALNDGDYSGFMNSPDYKFTQQQGLSGLDASAAANGSLYSGAHSKDLMSFSQGLASQYLGNYRNALTGMAGLGENAAAGQGNANQAYANAYGNNVNNAGQAQALGTLGSSSAYNNGINQATNALGQYASSYQANQNSYNNPNSPNYIPPVNPDYSANPDLSFNYG